MNNKLNSKKQAHCKEVKKTQKRAKETRENILNVSLEMFATQGFEKTSTRQIAKKADVNLCAIKYYFEDKLGLYKAVFYEPLKEYENKDLIEKLNNNNDLENALFLIFEHFINLLKGSEQVKYCIKIHMREILEPTGLLEEKIENEIIPFFNSLVNIIINTKKISKSQAQKISFSIFSMAIFLISHNHFINKISPELLINHNLIDDYHKDLVKWSLSIINSN